MQECEHFITKKVLFSLKKSFHFAFHLSPFAIFYYLCNVFFNVI